MTSPHSFQIAPVTHTEGPWQVSKQKARRVTNVRGVVICNAVLRNQGTAKGGAKHGAKDVLEAEANARLIAAAHDLLKAATFLLDQTDYFINVMFGGELEATPEVLAKYEAAHAAVASATGAA